MGGPSWGRQAEESVKRLQNRFGEEGVEEKLQIESDDDDRGGPTENLDPERIDEGTHLGLLAGKPHQRPDGKPELHAQDDLTGHEEISGLAFAIVGDDTDGGNDRDESGNHPAQPRRDAEVEEALHDDLP